MAEAARECLYARCDDLPIGIITVRLKIFNHTYGANIDEIGHCPLFFGSEQGEGRYVAEWHEVKVAFAARVPVPAGL